MTTSFSGWALPRSVRFLRPPLSRRAAVTAQFP